MSNRMLKSERKRFDKKIFEEEKDGFTFEMWEEKHHDCCVVFVVRKGNIVCREYRYPTIYSAFMIVDWQKGIQWLQKELDEGIMPKPSEYEGKSDE